MLGEQKLKHFTDFGEKETRFVQKSFPFFGEISHIATEFQFFWKIAHFEVDWQALVFETSSFSNLTETI